MGTETAVAALHVPELLEADVRCEAALRYMVVEQLQTDAVADDGRLPDGDVGERSRVYHAWLVLHSGAQRGIDGIAHVGRHRPRHLEVRRGDRLPTLVVGHGDLTDA